MAISLLQDAQTRSLAAALAGMKRDDVDRSMSLSPPMSANTSASSAVAMYPGLQQQAAAVSAFGMLSPTQLMAANRQAAAAFMAAQLPMSTLATTLFPHHPALFGSWAAQPQTTHMHSPPASPHSPMATTPVASTTANKHALTSPTTHSSTPNAHILAADQPIKKSRKLTIKKEFQTPNNNNNNNNNTNNNNNNHNNNGIELSMSVSDLYNTSGGPISPPSSGSSPNSTHENVTQATSNVGAAPAGKDPSRDKSFTCKTCSRSFGYKHVLQNHERTHTGEKPFECPECHKRFTRDHHLKTHMRLHTGEKPYHCSHCDRQFVQVANLRRHLRVHTGERPYTCEICEGKFSDSNQLKSHMLVHNGEKPFECERCHMKFRRRHHLLNHKCGIQSPPTPSISPAMSGEYPMGEGPTNQQHQLVSVNSKYALSSSYGSEESIDLGKPAQLPQHVSHSSQHSANGIDILSNDEDAPLDLSEDGGSSIDGNCGNNNRSRKSHDIRRVFRLPPPQIVHVTSEMPEQTEPEDLSMHSPRSTGQSGGHSTPESMSSMHMLPHDDLDLDELDDAASLYMRQQQQLVAAAALKHSMNLA